MAELEEEVPEVDASWRTTTVLLDADKSAPAQKAKKDLLEIMSGKFTPREKGRFRTIDKPELDALAKENGISVPAALAMIMEKEKKEGLIKKGVIEPDEQEVAAEGNPADDETTADEETTANDETTAGDEEGEEGEGGPSQEYDDEMVLAAKVALRLDERSNAPDRIYILAGYPSKVDEAQALCDGSTEGVSFDGIMTLVSKEGTSERSSSRRPLPSITADDYRYDEVVAADAAKAGDLPPPGKSPALSSALGSQIATAMSKGSCNMNALQDLCFSDVPCDDMLQSELVTSFNNVVGDAAIDRQMFKSYVEDLYVVPVPDANLDLAREAADAAVSAVQINSTLAGPWAQKKSALKFYVETLAGKPEASLNAAACLWACVNAVAIAAGETDQPPMPSGGSGPWMIAHSDKGSVSTAVAVTQLTGSLDNGVGSGDYGDVANARAMACDEEGAWERVTLPGVKGRKMMPPKPVFSIEERGIRRSEFHSFVDLTPAESERTRQVEQFGDMIKSIDPSAEWSFHNWKYWEELTGAALTRLLSDANCDGTITCTRYYAEMDTLLLALHTPTAPGRKGTRHSSVTSFVRSRKAFPDWRAEGFRASIPLTPRTMGAMNAVVDIPQAELRVADRKTQFFFPASHSVIRLSESAGSGAWLSVEKDGHCFGLREPVLLKDKPVEETGGKKKKTPKKKKGEEDEPEEYKSSFLASFLDGSRLTVSEGARIPTKPDGHGTVSVSNTLPTGLCVTNSSDGKVHQQYLTQSPSIPKAALAEDWRVILGTGAVMRMMSDGTEVVYFPEGQVAIRACKGNGLWHHTRCDGTRFSSKFSGIENLMTGVTVAEEPETDDKGPPVEADLEPVDVTTEVDPETHTMVVTRADGVTVITYTDNTKMVQHADETAMIQDPGKLSVRVEAPGFAAVDIDKGVEATAFKHAKGEQVAIKMGGERTRSVTSLQEGTVVETSYNTKVTTDVNGQVYTRKPSGEIVTAVDGGHVEFRTRAEADEMPTEERGECDSEPDAHAGVYIFDLTKGQLYLEDIEHNIFDVNVTTREGLVDLAGITDSTEIKEKLGDMYDAGVSAKSVVNDPLPPLLIIMLGDGSGIQLHRPEDIEHFCKVSERTPHHERRAATALIGEALSDGSSPNCHTFLQHLKAYPPKPPTALSCYQTAKVPQARPTLPMVVLSKHPPKKNESLPAPPAVIVRHLVEIKPMGETKREELWQALAKWEAWREDRASQEDRFSVIDARPTSHLENEAAIQKQIMKAYKARRQKQRHEREREREKARQAAAAEAAAAAAAGGTPELQPALDIQLPEDEEDDGEEYEFTDSDDDRDEEPEEIAPEVQSLWDAFDSHKEAETNCIEDLQDVRSALIQVMCQGVPASDFKQLIAEVGIEVSEEDPDACTVDLDMFTKLVEACRAMLQAEEDEYEQEQRLVAEAAERGQQRRQQGATGRARGEVFWETDDGQETLRIIPAIPPKNSVYDIINEETPSSAFKAPAEPNDADQDSNQTNFADYDQMGLSGQQTMQGSLASSTRRNRQNRADMSATLEDKLSISTMNARMSQGEARVDACRGRSADVDVYGDARPKPVRQRPRSKGEPNDAYMEREAGMMRLTNTASTRLPDGGSIDGIERFFEISPVQLVLGQLQVNQEYRASFMLKNVGAAPSRFRIVVKDSRPEDMNYVRLLNNPPGALSPGMAVNVEVQIKTGSVGPINDIVEIHAMTEVFQVPVKATVRSSEMYDITKTNKTVCVVQAGDILPISMLVGE